MARWLRLVVALGAIAVLWLPVVARADGAEEDQFAALIGRERAGAGLAQYSGAADLVDVARGQARRMATEGRLYHNPNLATEVQDWDGVGENVGRGWSVEQIHDAFMGSPDHRREILSATFTQVGVGVAIAADGEIWVAEVFRQPSAPTPAAGAPAAAAPPTTSPRETRRAPKPTRARTTPVAAAVAAPVVTPPLPAPVQPDLSALAGAFDLGPPARPGSPVAGGAVDHEPDVAIPVRVAATLLVLVVIGQTRFVLSEGLAGLPEVGGIWRLRRRRRPIAATATTTP